MSQSDYVQNSVKYKRLDKEKRIKIECYLRRGISQAETARRIGVDKGTVCREIKRGSVKQKREIVVKPCYENYFTCEIKSEYYYEYFADTGQAVAEEYIADRLKKCSVTFEKGYADFIDEQILGGKKTVSVYTANVLAAEAGYKAVSDRTLYNWIHAGLLKVGIMDLLLTVQRKPRRNAKDKTRKRIYGDSIDLRSDSINKREEFGHFEGDSIVGAEHKGQIITLVERQTRVGFMFKFDEMNSKNIRYVKKILQIRYGKNFSKVFKSITFDNGSEFSHNIQDKALKVYYAHPYSSYERGSNENFNGIVRRYIKKGKDFSTLTNTDVLRINNAINLMPRKLLNGKASLQYFKEQIAKLINPPTIAV